MDWRSFLGVEHAKMGAAGTELSALNEEGYRYFAFISFTGKDKAYARKLHRALERYHIPRVSGIDENSAYAKLTHIRPVFIYTEDMTHEASLPESLRRALRESKYLVVVCSPRSARPPATGRHWVNEEISYFRSLGRERNIIPVIMEGNPQHGSPDCCYPPALGEIDGALHLGLSAHAQRFSDTILQIVAWILGARYDTLRKRHLRRRRQQVAWTLGTVLLVLATSLLVWDWKYRYKEYYYSDYTWLQSGIPRGVNPVDSPRGYNELFRFVYQGGKVVRLVHVNGHDVPIDYASEEENDFWQKPVCADYHYDDNGRVEATIRDENGKILRREEYRYRVKDTYACPYEVVFKSSTQEDEIRNLVWRLDSASNAGAAGSANVGYGSCRQFYYTEKGGVIRQQYQDGNDDSVADLNGVIARNYELDAAGRIVKTSLEYQPNTRAPEGQIAQRRYRYDGQGHLEEVAYYDVAGGPCADEEGVGRCRYVWRDNLKLREDYFSVHGRPGAEVLGVSAIGYTYNDDGTLKACVFLDEHHKPVNARGYGYAACEMKYEPHSGKESRVGYVDAEGKPYSALGYSLLRYGYELTARPSVWQRWGITIRNEAFYREMNLRFVDLKHGAEVLAEHSSGSDEAQMLAGAPLDEEGTAGFDTVLEDYDSSKTGAHRERTVWVNAQGGRTRCAGGHGYAVRCRRYNSLGELGEESYWDASQRPRPALCHSLLPALQYHRVEYGYPQGEEQHSVNPQSVTYFGLDDKPCHITMRMGDGVSVKFSRALLSWDKCGRLTGMSFRDAQGQPAWLSQSIVAKPVCGLAVTYGCDDIRTVSFVDSEGTKYAWLAQPEQQQ